MAAVTVPPGAMITLVLLPLTLLLTPLLTLLVTLVMTQTLPATKVVPLPRVQKVMVMVMVVTKAGATGGMVM